MTTATTSPALSVVLPYWLDRPALEAVDIARNAEATGIAGLWIGEMIPSMRSRWQARSLARRAISR
ncbi:MAG TPA: hypothetical protein VEL28_11075 [Candidatus Binatia bacterium]|nr:hypothetical protein [Candidatus Binatia bacterium]